MVLHVHVYNYWFWLNYKNMIKVISDEKKNYATSSAEHTVIVWVLHNAEKFQFYK